MPKAVTPSCVTHKSVLFTASSVKSLTPVISSLSSPESVFSFSAAFASSMYITPSHSANFSTTPARAKTSRLPLCVFRRITQSSPPSLAT